MTRRISALILALCLLFTCISVSQAESEAVKITFWHSMSDEAGAALEQIVADYNAGAGAENGIQVEAVYQGSYADATTKLNSLLSAGQTADLPDVMQMDATGKVVYASSGVAYTVDDALADHPDDSTDSYLSAALANWNYAGVQLGIPFATSTTVMYYNKTLLDAAGMEAPATFADIIALSQALPEATADGTELMTYAAVPNTPTLANWLGQLGSYVVDNRNGSEGTATQLVCIDNGALVTFLTEWKSMADAGALTSLSSGTTDAFVAGQLAIMTSSSSSVTSILEKVGDSFEVGVAAYPRVNDSSSAGATVSGSCLVMFATGAEKQEAAWSFIKEMTGAQVQAQFAIATGYTPSCTAAGETEAYQALVAEKPIYAVALNQLQETPADMRSVTVGPSADFYYAIQDCVTEMLEDDLTPEETAQIMADELNGLLTQYNQANP